MSHTSKPLISTDTNRHNTNSTVHAHTDSTNHSLTNASHITQYDCWSVIHKRSSQARACRSIIHRQQTRTATVRRHTEPVATTAGRRDGTRRRERGTHRMVEGCKHNHATQMTQCHPECESTKNETHCADSATSTASDQPAPERGSSWLGHRGGSLRAVRRGHSQEMHASSRSTGNCPSQWPVAHTQCAIEKRIMHDAEGTTTHTLSLCHPINTQNHVQTHKQTNTQTRKDSANARQHHAHTTTTRQYSAGAPINKIHMLTRPPHANQPNRNNSQRAPNEGARWRKARKHTKQSKTIGSARPHRPKPSKHRSRSHSRKRMTQH